jgi:hypothetical protein
MIRFELSRAGNVAVDLFDVTGRLVMQLYNGETEAGQHELQISSSGLASGIYFYRMRADGFSYSRKMMVMK